MFLQSNTFKSDSGSFNYPDSHLNLEKDIITVYFIF